MANITRWNPVREFDDLMSRYNRLLGLTPGTDGGEGKDLFSSSDWTPAVDIKETPEAFNIEAELPGMSKDDVKVTVQNGVLSIEGERKQEEETDDKKQHRIERFYGSFLRRFTLPANVDEDSVKASFKDGVLSLTLTKTEPAEPKAIEVDVQ
ncbi:Hsp20/alpha crystallin family protein [Marinobacter orientalis]|uniref:Hsp20/alpha crystallin family protein n=1 Tax=Marinobacter orientalis TaxID=1928859 RepID=A0A7Y0NK13_9GAMM|nr:Hsp20/alpha crystallin family protein [Marinobacter orientalis]NMT62767.1 Hsp20/alpha crystallin family protein [Marinobacter orientalis]TGX51447.1 Hsp20/alpha crystallin family protein [Marinobacter orientalis]